MEITINIPNDKYCNSVDNCPCLNFTRDENPYCSIFSDLKKGEYLEISSEHYNIIKHPKCKLLTELKCKS